MNKMTKNTKTKYLLIKILSNVIIPKTPKPQICWKRVNNNIRGYVGGRGHIGVLGGHRGPPHMSDEVQLVTFGLCSVASFWAKV